MLANVYRLCWLYCWYNWLILFPTIYYKHAPYLFANNTNFQIDIQIYGKNGIVCMEMNVEIWVVIVWARWSWLGFAISFHELREEILGISPDLFHRFLRHIYPSSIHPFPIHCHLNHTRYQSHAAFLQANDLHNIYLNCKHICLSPVFRH